MTPEPSAQLLSAADYVAFTSAVLSSVEATTDRWLESGVIDIDSHRTGGLLELTLPNGSKLIVNTQPPLQELWLAAKAGGFHFKFVNSAWRDTKDGREFFSVLSTCASAQSGQDLRFYQHA